MLYRLAIFDFDGTLADSFPWFLGMVNGLADAHGFRRIEEHEIEMLRGQGARQIAGHFGVPAWKLPRIAHDMRRQMTRDIAGIALFPGVDRLLRELAGRGIRLAIVTSNSLGNVRQVLGPDSAALIQHYECGASLFGKRPKLRAVLRASGVPAAEAISIGDEIRDLEAARAEGIAFGAVTWGYTNPEALRAQNPEKMFVSPEEILQKLC
ncbi:MAG TPA: HAD hydrolase-like protein [Thermoanaerobaculia bacterium]|jgi:phosphoglycolate phosphatase|nr:HAD hydrolase-like protein [Thermoanaerobaculia bacterium]